MDNWLKGLVVAACLVIIAAGAVFIGSYAYSAYRANRYEAARSAYIQDCEAALPEVSAAIVQNDNRAKFEARIGQIRDCILALSDSDYAVRAEHTLNSIGYSK